MSTLNHDVEIKICLYSLVIHLRFVPEVANFRDPSGYSDGVDRRGRAGLLYVAEISSYYETKCD